MVLVIRITYVTFSGSMTVNVLIVEYKSNPQKWYYDNIYGILAFTIISFFKLQTIWENVLIYQHVLEIKVEKTFSC